jgi:hypothetical protein
MSDFQLSTPTIIQLLGDPEFYNSCVSYLFMRDQGLASVKQFHKAVLDKEEGCEGCDNKHKNEMSYVSGAIGAFVRISRELYAVDPKHLEPVRDFLVVKLGSTTGAIIMYYKESGTMQTLKF